MLYSIVSYNDIQLSGVFGVFSSEIGVMRHTVTQMMISLQ